MANSKRELFLKRRLRVRNKIKATANGRLRLSVHRSGKNISVMSRLFSPNGTPFQSFADIGLLW